jgi:WD40 repeat protein
VDTGETIDTLVGQGMMDARLAFIPDERTPRLAFSPDGRTLAHVDDKGVIRIRDVVAKQAILTLDGRHGPLNGFAFRPDGRQLAAAAQDGTVLLWDAAPMTPELRILREARSVVEFLSAQKLTAAEITARIRRDPTISDAVRTRALELAEHLP